MSDMEKFMKARREGSSSSPSPAAKAPQSPQRGDRFEPKGEERITKAEKREKLNMLITSAIADERKAAVGYANMTNLAIELGYDNIARKLSDISLDQATHELTLKELVKELRA